MTGRLDIERLLAGLTLRRVGRIVAGGANVELVEAASSTNDLAWAHGEASDADGFVVFAEHQTSGRGRLGRRWESPRGASLLLSVLLVGGPSASERGGADATSTSRAVAPPCGTGILPVQGHAGPQTHALGPARDLFTDSRLNNAAPQTQALGPRLGLLAAVAAHDAIADTTGVQVEIKWPNDLLAGGRKLGGVLVESRSPLVRSGAGASAAASAGPTHVVGIGLNCLQQRAHFPPELRDRATSLDLVATGPVDRTALARALLVHLDRWCADPSGWTGEQVRRAWLDRAAPLGARIHLQHGGRRYSGHVIDLDPTASLLVQLDSGERRLFDAAATTVLDI